MKRAIEENPDMEWPDVEDNCQPGVEDYDYGGRRERFGNNRKKVKRSVKRKRAAIAKLSRRRNRR